MIDDRTVGGGGDTPFLGETPTMTSGVADAEATPPRLEPGSPFGSYRIDRLLGKGGMGEVYEAVRVDQQRRIALKILSRALQTRESREQFLREGRLAASISHPNTVYVFGSEDIGGIPTIAMELVPAGTLKDRIAHGGPMTVRAAADATLQIVAGLEAAHAAGILHRDVKPANCFIESDGTVKVGDFGLSISTHAGANPAAGVIEGTPAFAPPEQLQGRPLDLRADIYAVGATLFYLLTGRPPFDGGDIAGVIGRVQHEPAPALRAVRRDVPAPVAGIVARCLAKNPDARPSSYAALADALTPFGSAAPAAAGLGARVLAYLIDRVLVLMALMGLAALVSLGRSPAWAGEIVLVLYFAAWEGWVGASPGKRACRVCVRRLEGGTAGFARAGARATIFAAMLAAGPLLLRALVALGWIGANSRASGMLEPLFTFAAAGLIFCTARSSNGYRGIHEVLTATQTVRPRAPSVRAVDQADVAAIEACPARIGPYAIERAPIGVELPALIAGFDPQLRRAVWVRVRSADAPGVSPARAAVRRRTRAQWLSGGTWDGVGYDAYERVDGEPLTVVVARQGPRPWPVARQWLDGLAAELRAALEDGTAEALSLRQVWIERTGNVRLLDWEAGADSLPAVGFTGDAKGAQRFLAAVARHAAGSQHLPLRATRVVEQLEQGAFANAADAAAAVHELLQQPADLARGPRIAQVTLAGLGAIIWQAFVDSPRMQGAGHLLPTLAATAAVAGLAAATRGGLGIRTIGGAVVDASGQEISRGRAAVRAALAWLPVAALVGPFMLVMSLWVDVVMRRPIHVGDAVTPGTIALAVALGAWAVYARSTDDRTWHDRVAGTWLVPR